MRGIGKRFVYVLRSDRDPARHYVGLTSDVENRLEWHNHSPCGHTIDDRPWSLVVVIEFPSEQQAIQFEPGRAQAHAAFSATQVPESSLKASQRYDAVIVCVRRHRFRNPTEIRIE